MADKAKPIATSNDAKLVSGGKGRHFHSKLKYVIAELSNLSQSGEGLREYEDFVESRTKLQQEVGRKKQELEKLKAFAQSEQEVASSRIEVLEQRVADKEQYHAKLLEDFVQKAASWNGEVSRLKKDSAALLQTKGQVVELQATLKQRDDESTSLQSLLRDREDRLQKLEQERDTAIRQRTVITLQCEEKEQSILDFRSRVTELEKSLGLVDMDRPKMIAEIAQIARRISSLVRVHFDCPIPEPESQGILRFANGPSQIPLVPSNSIPAKAMRCAFAQTIIARELSRRICAFPTISGVDLTGVVRFVEWLSDCKPDEATTLRCQISKACTAVTDSDTLLTEVTTGLCEKLNPWLGHDTVRLREFRFSLMAASANLLRLWQLIQRNQQSYQATTMVTDGHEVHYRLEQDPDSPRTRHDAIPIAVIFPQIYDALSLQPLFCGYALFNTQDIVVAAIKETNAALPVEKKGLRRKPASVERT